MFFAGWTDSAASAQCEIWYVDPSYTKSSNSTEYSVVRQITEKDDVSILEDRSGHAEWSGGQEQRSGESRETEEAQDAWYERFAGWVSSDVMPWYMG